MEIVIVHEDNVYVVAKSEGVSAHDVSGLAEVVPVENVLLRMRT
jgi:predicted RNA-binding protein